jgi:hypothetical protein
MLQIVTFCVRYLNDKTYSEKATEAGLIIT